MQNYGQQQAAYQRPGSTTGYASGPAVPPPYGAPQGYQAATSASQNQWAPPTQNQTPAQHQWNQQQQQTAGYNPGVYGAMPGGYSQGQQPSSQTSTAYPPQHDVPPPPPPKPAAFASTAQQNTQGWAQTAGYSAQQPQQNIGYAPQGQQGGQYGHDAPQQTYSNTAPPPPSQTPGGSYFPPSQTPQTGARPTSVYGTDQTGLYSTPSSAVAQHPPSSVLSPNEQHPAYIPPSLSGQGVQSYVPSNTNPLPGVYVPPPPDVPAWQQASHAPLQGGNKFKYTRPAPDPNLYGPGMQGSASGQYAQQLAQPPQPSGQMQYPPTQQPYQYGQFPQNQHPEAQVQPQDPFGGNIQGQYNQPAQQGQYSGQIALPYQQPQEHSAQTHAHPQQPQNQWQAAPAEHGSSQQQPGTQGIYSGQHQAWQPGHQVQNSGGGQGIQAPRPVSGQAGSTSPAFVNEPSPQSQPVSPIQNRFSTNFAAGHAGLGRTGSVSSIALGAIHAQRAGNRTESPKLPPPRDDATKFSALGTGGPSDWEHFGGGGEEVDDEELFQAKKDGRQGVPVQLDSVEVPMQHEWPTPIVQPATESVPDRDTYQPTPPPDMVTRPPPLSNSSQQFEVSNAVATPHASQEVHGQQGFVMGDAVIAPLRASRPSSQRNTPTQQHGWQRPPSTAIQPVAPPVHQNTDTASAAELKAKDDALQRLQANFEEERANSRKEIEQLKIRIETTQTHAEYEKNVLVEQIETIKVAAEQATIDSNALTQEKDSTIERLKEDGEGKEDTIREKDAEITRIRDELKAKDETINKGHTVVDDLKHQLEAKLQEIGNLKQQIENNQTAERLADDLRHQLEAEKSKELPKPTPASLIPDLDPWYAGSLDRYITMLRKEALEPSVEEKIKVFTSFITAESSARGLQNYTAAPPVRQIAQRQEESTQSTTQSSKDASVATHDKGLHVQVPRAESPEDDVQYSPGGRPIVQQRRPGPRLEEFGHPQQAFSVSSQSTVLTPTSSQDDIISKTPTPLQSPPKEPQAHPQYKAYVPPSMTQTDSVQNLHRQSISSGSPAVLNPAFSYTNKKDEVFFGASPRSGTPSSRPTTGGNATPDAVVPAPLFTKHPTALATKSAPRDDSVERLTRLLPIKVQRPQSSPGLDSIRTRLAELPVDPSLVDLTTHWEKSASLARKKNDDARRKRQEESEDRTNQLFDEHEISYADIAVIEDEQKENERELKAEEDRDEYQSYVENVFDKVYDGLQQQIKRLTDLYNETEAMLSSIESGVKSLEGSDTVVAHEWLKLYEDLFEAFEQRHDKVVEAIAERNKRYKKTQIQPLYAAGNITKMKQVEKHFATSEKEDSQRARDEKAGRVAKFVELVEATVKDAVAVEQQEIQGIIEAARDIPASTNDAKLLARAKEAVLTLGDSSKALLQLLNDIEIDIGGSVLEAELRDARADRQMDRVAALEKQITEREVGLKEEFKQKEMVLDQDRAEIDKVIKAKRDQPAEDGKVELTEEQIRKERLDKALEEAKRRNGDL